MGFGRLRVINDDTIAPLGKFGMHAHQDFEIITIPLRGVVTHEDSLGNRGEVRTGEVQAMSAGTGVTHSEENASTTETLDLFQIWIEPRTLGARPRYEQARFDEKGRKNAWQVLVSGDGTPGALPIYADARIARADLEIGKSLDYGIIHPGNGAYVLVVEGDVEIDGERLEKRDAVGISDAVSLCITAHKPSSLLLIEVPMV